LGEPGITELAPGPMTDLTRDNRSAGPDSAGEVRKLALDAEQIGVGKSIHQSRASRHETKRSTRAIKRCVE
jgi:hypothetical protein